MSKQRRHPLRNNCKQLTWIVLGFVFCISLLEAKGFVIWAKRLEVGTVQQSVLTTAEGIDGFWSTVAKPVTNIRPNALQFLTQHGWSDMPADLVEDEALNENPVPELVDKGGEENPQEQPGDNVKDPVEPPIDEGAGIDEPEVEPKNLLPEGWLPLEQPKADGKLPPLLALREGEKRHIVLAGDSMMAVGVASQLQRELVPFNEVVTTSRAYRAATGLARPDVFDWQKEYPLMVGNKKPDVVIVAIGANDTQNLEVNRKVLVIGSSEWRAEYELRLNNYINMLTKDGAVVLWIKLPPMRPNKYNNNVTVVNEVAYKVLANNPRVIWWDVSSRFLSSAGKFQEFAVITPGQRQVRIRQTDGIHITENGAKLISTDIIAWLNLEGALVETPPAKVAVNGEQPEPNAGEVEEKVKND